MEHLAMKVDTVIKRRGCEAAVVCVCVCVMNQTQTGR